MGDFGNDVNTNGRLNVGGSQAGNIETGGDTDWFRMTLTAKNTYQFDLFGFDSALGSLPDPLLILFDLNGNELARNDNKPNPEPGFTLFDSQLTFQAQYTGFYFFSANATNAFSTGTYVTAAKQVDDFVQDTNTTGAVALGGAAVSGSIEKFWDRDWFAVNNLVQGEHYQFNLMGSSSNGGSLSNPNLRLYDGGGNLLTQDNNGGTGTDSLLDFMAPWSGFFFLSASGISTGTGTYMLTGRQVLPSYTLTMLNTNQSMGINNLYTAEQIGTVNGYQMYDAVNNNTGFLTNNGVPQASQTFHNASAATINNWAFRGGAATQVSQDDLYIRSQVDNNWGCWKRIPIETLPNVNNALNSGQALVPNANGSILYAFAGSLPGYFNAANYPNFQATTYAQQEAIRTILGHISKFTGLVFRETWRSFPAHMTIFQAALGGGEFVRSFLPDNTTSGTQASDLVFNTSNAQNSTVPGSLGYYRLLQAVGNAVGLNLNPFGLPNQVNNNHYTVMSNTPSPHRPGAFLSKFGVLDVKVLQTVYGVNGNTKTGPDTYYLEPGVSNLVTTIYDDGGIDTVNGSDQNVIVKIRLTEGKFSEVGNNTFLQKHYVAYGTKLENALGSNVRDAIIGNALNNVLDGRGGNDFMRGEQGDDLITGGNGHDRIEYFLGDGNDTIMESGGGRDVLQIRSYFWLDSLANDLRFKREGNDLLIDLNFDEHPNKSQGTIRIKDMHNGPNRVETLRLLTGSGQSVNPNTSLVSAFNQSNASWQRFTNSPLSDQFGRLVVPVN